LSAVRKKVNYSADWFNERKLHWKKYFLGKLEEAVKTGLLKLLDG